MFRKDPFLALYFSLSSSMIFLLLCLLPSAAFFTLTIWPFGSSSSSVLTEVEVTQGALFRLERWSEYWCLPLNPSKSKASFFSVDPNQASLYPYLFLFNSRFRFNPTPTFLGITYNSTLFFFVWHIYPPFTRKQCIAMFLDGKSAPTPTFLGITYNSTLFFLYLAYLSSIHEKAMYRYVFGR